MSKLTVDMIKLSISHLTNHEKEKILYSKLMNRVLKSFSESDYSKEEMKSISSLFK